MGFKVLIDAVGDYTYNVCMDELEFRWDETKEKANIRKHGVSFGEARTVFFDENAVQFFDPDHSESEGRFILLGLSFKPRVLVVCHCYRESETVVRLISARKADKDEEHEYWRRRK
jgi:uncharacterized DUF497 family protein